MKRQAPDMSGEDVWDDSALVKAYEKAVNHYLVSHGKESKYEEEQKTGEPQELEEGEIPAEQPPKQPPQVGSIFFIVILIHLQTDHTDQTSQYYPETYTQEQQSYYYSHPYGYPPAPPLPPFPTVPLMPYCPRHAPKHSHESPPGPPSADQPMRDMLQSWYQAGYAAGFYQAQMEMKGKK
ncbi:hypothetical protein PROFUN_06084 [Planoprotostelium fungivorum]|uniref:Survival Motor Neuron Gemin2-binding domain-containing protein n=1 Tax=Planoprotostelium fungivorum TaxID=1890364 RepID=A0A2P6NPT5_9EUKA|nr:hypothetical protein PROFUN_06084 [Planoprotostelium fungivorum]